MVCADVEHAAAEVEPYEQLRDYTNICAIDETAAENSI